MYTTGVYYRNWLMVMEAKKSHDLYLQAGKPGKLVIQFSLSQRPEYWEADGVTPYL